MTTISVDAAWRVSQVVFTTPHDAAWTLVGTGEMLLRDPEDITKAFGVMPGATVMRMLDTVMEETVEIDGKPIPFSLVLDVMKAFLDKWRVEDADKSQAQALVAPPPQPDPTPVLRVPGQFIIAPEV